MGPTVTTIRSCRRRPYVSEYQLSNCNRNTTNSLANILYERRRFPALALEELEVKVKVTAKPLPHCQGALSGDFAEKFGVRGNPFPIILSGPGTL